MAKMIPALLVVLLASLAGSVVADSTKEPEKRDRLLLQWTSQQQMNWEVRIRAEGFRFVAVPLAASDTGDEQGKQKVAAARDGGSLSIESVTGWSTSSALVEIEPSKPGSVSVEIRDPYVKDRHTEAQFSLADLKQGRTITITSKEWPIRNCTLRLTTNPSEVETETQLMKSLGTDRKKNVRALLRSADRAESKSRRTDLLLRAAAAASGGCNHGPLQPNGWDLAIATYQKVIDENKGTDTAVDAMWAQASCHACCSPFRGCDKDCIGKGDWDGAVKLYEKLYQVSTSPSDRADALRRMAEVQCFEADECDSGLRNYRKIAEEFPGTLPPSTHWTYRTCAPHSGTEQLAWDIYRAMVYNSSDKHGVQSMFNDSFRDIKGNHYIDEVALLVQSTSGKRSGQVEPKIITRKELILVGAASDGSDIHGTWVKYEEKQKAIKHKVEGACYEWHDWDAHKCMVGTEVTDVESVPEGMTVMRIPAGEYAVFTHRLANGGYTGLNSVMNEWLTTGPYEQLGDDSIQVFDQRFKEGNQPDSEIDFWIPVKPRA